MALRYLKSAGGNWNAASTWSATSSAGVDNAGVPTASDDVILEAGSGSLSINAVAVCRSFDCMSGTGDYAGTVTHGNFGLSVGTSTAGPSNIAMRLSSGMTYNTTNIAASALNFISTSTNQQVIDRKGKTVGNTVINGLGSSYILASNFLTTGNFTITTGALATANYTISALSIISTGSAVRSFLAGTSTLNLNQTSAAALATISGSNLTLDLTQATLVIGPAITARTLALGTMVAGTVQWDVPNSQGLVYISGSPTIKNLILGNSRSVSFQTGGQVPIIENFSGAGANNGYQSFVGGQTGTTSGVHSVDASHLQITGSLTFDARIGMSTWNVPGSQTIISKYSGTAGYYFRFVAGGFLQLTLLNVSTVIATSTLSTQTVFNPGDVGYVRAIWNQSTSQIIFYTSTDGITYTQLGTAISASLASIGTTADPLYIGQRTTGNDNFIGNIYRVRMWTDITQTNLVYDANFETKQLGLNAFNDSSSYAVPVIINGEQNQAGDGRLGLKSQTPGTIVNFLKYGANIDTNYLAVYDLFSMLPFKLYAGSGSYLSNTQNVLNYSDPGLPYILHENSSNAATATPSVNLLYPVPAGSLLVAFLSVTSSPATTITPPSGWTFVDWVGADANNARSYTFYKVADGTETGETFTLPASTTTTLKMMVIDGFNGTPTLGVTSKQTGPGSNITSWATDSGSGPNNTETDAIAIAGWGSNSSLGATVSLTNDFQIIRNSPELTNARVALKPIGVSGNVLTTLTWTTARRGSAQLLVFYGSGIAGRTKVKIGGVFTVKPSKVRIGGTFVTKPVKVKVGGVFI